MGIFEAIMMICFGAAWPMNIYRSYKAKTVKGTSIAFLLTLETGYISGMINKILYSYDFVFYLYLLNFFMVAVNIVIYFRNRRLDNRRKAWD